RNAMAGLAWALTLVNLRTPKILELFLANHRTTLVAYDAFANGVRSAAQVWHVWAPATHYLDDLRQHRPDSRNLGLVQAWDDLIRRACEQDIADELEVLTAGQQLESLFHDRPLGARGQPSADDRRDPPRKAAVSWTEPGQSVSQG